MSDVDTLSISPFARLTFGRVLLFPALALGAMLVLIFLPPASRTGAGLTGAAYVFYGALLLAALGACRRAGVRLSDVMGPAPRETRAYAAIPLIVLLLLVFAALSLWLTIVLASLVAPAWALELLAADDRSSMTELFRGEQKVLLALVVVLFGPFIEEFVFRGMLLRRWLATRGLWTGLLGSAAVFAILHPPSWLGAFATGIVLGVVYLWTRSLMIPLLIHVLYNGVVALVILSTGSGSPSSAKPTGLTMLRDQWPSLGAAFVVTGILIVLVLHPMLRQIRAAAASAAPP